MKIQPATKEAFQLLLEGSLALAQVEANGIRIDTEYLNKATQQIETEIKEKTEALQKDKTFRIWKREFGDKTKIGSGDQLAHVIFSKLKYKCPGKTATGKYRSDQSAFEDVDLPFVKDWFKLDKLKNANGTFLNGIRREVVDGYLHPSFNLNTVETFRGSSSSPNFQNIPIRNPEIGKLIRQCFIPRKGRVLVEIDFGALEFRISAAFWADPKMIEYASDKTKDIHRDQAALCYKTSNDQVSKQMRYAGKNQFVFPEIYGSYYVQMARKLWESTSKENFKLKDDKTLVRDWLANNGIKSLGKCNPRQRTRPGTFEHHIKEVEDDFNRRFNVFASSKEKWWRDYQKRGWFRMLTGFIVSGVYSRNFLMNCPIQGPGFHCLLWSLIELQKWLNKYKFDTLIVGEIHDNILSDVPICELQDFLYAAERIMTKEIRKAWKWIVVPLEVEVDVTPVDGNWHQKAQWIENGSEWVPK